MTNIKKLLKWISGNYQIETGTNSPQFTTPLSRTNNFATLFSSQFPYGYFFIQQHCRDTMPIITVLDIH